MKTCGNCKVVQTEKNSNRILSGRQSGQFQSYCKECSLKYHKERRVTHPEPYKRASLKYLSKPETKSIERLNHLRRLYGLSQSDFQILLTYQKSKCAICKEVFQKTPHVDHCHKTGKVRGLLCTLCNTSLGGFKDSPVRLLAAAAYIQKTS